MRFNDNELLAVEYDDEGNGEPDNVIQELEGECPFYLQVFQTDFPSLIKNGKGCCKLQSFAITLGILGWIFSTPPRGRAFGTAISLSTFFIVFIFVLFLLILHIVC